ncbi:hypothetical protein ASG29_10750 [Sphingomonas sp. Leaf412]|uniref:DUF885 domain-containing protein n=1 Tax=Sphingomonas sp. Leaf412 TaxID=1736370 RepID=UPI0006FD77EE|nr:DUF885 domain-containing protein [Sphingomonas sp. Leaf412]KQT32287.1 hypothetical protein ASG29_10750 [Sphingomonas sp. Leaf412]
MRLIALLLAATVPLPALAQSPAPRPPVAKAGDSAEDAKLSALFHASDEATLRLNPLSALFRGDMRWPDRIGDLYTDGYRAAQKANLERDLAALRTIDRARLSPVNRIAYDVFRTDAQVALRGFAPEYRALDEAMPITHFFGLQAYYPDIVSGTGAAPFKTVADYDATLRRTSEYAAILDRIVARFRAGLAAGITEPKLVVRNMIGQFDALIAEGVEGSTFYAPVKTFPAGIPAAEQARLRAAYAAQIRDVVTPAHVRIRDFLRDTYLPRARDTVGLSALPGGAAYYDYLIEAQTTLPQTADAVHTLGLSEVARILREMEKQKAATGFEGDLPAFFTYLRTEPRFQPKTAEELRLDYEAIGRRVATRIPEQFSLLPRAKLEIRPVPAFREKGDAAGSYNQGTPDGSRPGIFYYNTYDLKNRYKWGEETLYLHEAVPGHHFQISLAQENEALPAFMRFGGNTAYVEGWALYAETLWKELGVESDPYQRMGGLNDEMLRAMRLVVDTGLHAKGWTRDRAIKYMTDNSPMPLSDATAEVERYIAVPGQALAYKTGALTIQRLKAKAQATLGATFDPRRFHAAVLDTGALPMTVLEKKIDDWIAAGGE